MRRDTQTGRAGRQKAGECAPLCDRAKSVPCGNRKGILPDPAKCCRQYARENKKEEEALCPMRKAATMDKNPDAEPTRVVRLTDPNCSSVFSAFGSCFSGMPFWYPALSGWQPCADPGHPCKCQPTSCASWVVHEFAHNLFSRDRAIGGIRWLF